MTYLEPLSPFLSLAALGVDEVAPPPELSTGNADAFLFLTFSAIEMTLSVFSVFDGHTFSLPADLLLIMNELHTPYMSERTKYCEGTLYENDDNK